MASSDDDTMAASHAPASHSGAPSRQVPHHGQGERPFGPPERGEADVGGELGPVESSGPQLGAGAHGPPGGMGGVGGPPDRMVVPEPIGDQDVDVDAGERTGRVAEHRLGPGVGRHDQSVGVGHDGGVGHQAQHGVDQLCRARVGVDGQVCEVRAGSTCRSAPFRGSHWSNANGVTHGQTGGPVAVRHASSIP